MDSCKVKIFLVAKQDSLDTTDCLNTLLSDTTLCYYDLLAEQSASLAQMPERCPHPKELALTAKRYQYLIVKDSILFSMPSPNA